MANLELYSPELKQSFNLDGSLRTLLFYDFGRGFNNQVTPNTSTPGSVSIASVGGGFRYALGKDASVRFDLAQVVDAGPVNTKGRSEWRGHLAVMMAF